MWRPAGIPAGHGDLTPPNAALALD